MQTVMTQPKWKSAAKRWRVSWVTMQKLIRKLIVRIAIVFNWIFLLLKVFRLTLHIIHSLVKAAILAAKNPNRQPWLLCQTFRSFQTSQGNSVLWCFIVTNSQVSKTLNCDHAVENRAALHRVKQIFKTPSPQQPFQCTES